MKKLSLSSQNILVYFLLFGISILYFFVSRIGYQKQNIDLNKIDKITDFIENRGEGYRLGSNNKPKVFFIKLKSIDKKLGVYRMSRNYEDLISEINIGDRITAFYYDNKNTTENINIDLVQLEKNGKLILDKKEYESKEGSLLYIGIFGLLSNLYIGYRTHKKYKLLRKSSN